MIRCRKISNSMEFRESIAGHNYLNKMVAVYGETSSIRHIEFLSYLIVSQAVISEEHYLLLDE